MTCCRKFLMCSPPGPLNPFPPLDLSDSSVEISGNILFKHNSEFLTHPSSPSCITLN